MSSTSFIEEFISTKTNGATAEFCYIALKLLSIFSRFCFTLSSI